MLRSRAPRLLSLRTTRLPPAYSPITRRLASTAPASKSSSWRSFFLRLGLAGGVVYYYNTSPFFADEPAMLHITPDPENPLPTIDSLRPSQRPSPSPTINSPGTDSIPTPGGNESTEALEAEAGQQGAFNPETGEINWDCPCLGGMAHGPCGEEFKAAFSCFVYSENEPKGMECVDKFKGMQECFRQHPDIYGAELEDDEEAEAEAMREEKEWAKEEADEIVAESKDQVGEATESVNEKAELMKEAAKDVAEKGSDKVSQTLDTAKDAAAKASDKVTEKVGEIKARTEK